MGQEILLLISWLWGFWQSPLKHCSSCPKGKVLNGNYSLGAVAVKCPPESPSWPGLLLRCVLCPQECADLANDDTEHALSPVEPQAFSLSVRWLFSKLQWLHWLSLHYPQGEARRRAGGRKYAFLMAVIPAGFEFSHQEISWSFTFYQFRGLVQNPSGNTNFYFWKKFQLDVIHHRIVLERQRKSVMILV